MSSQNSEQSTHYKFANHWIPGIPLKANSKSQDDKYVLKFYFDESFGEYTMTKSSEIVISYNFEKEYVQEMFKRFLTDSEEFCSTLNYTPQYNHEFTIFLKKD